MSSPIKHRIKLGETYRWTAVGKDADGNVEAFDESWDIVCQITKKKVGGEVMANPAVSIVDGAAVMEVDTGDEGWETGRYYVDMRFSGAEGYDDWSDAVLLIVQNRNSPKSS